MTTRIDASANIGTALTKVGAVGATGSGIAGWLSENHQVVTSLGVLTGIAVGVIGLGIQWYYLHKRDRRELDEHRARLRQ